LAACDDCEEVPCDFDAYLTDLAGEGAAICNEAECALAALEAGRPLIYRYAEHPNFSLAYVYTGEDAPRADAKGAAERYFDVSFGKLGGDIVQRSCEALAALESSPDGLECVGGAMRDGFPEYPATVCSKAQCNTPLG
jgi:hypothetical protein